MITIGSDKKKRLLIRLKFSGLSTREAKCLLGINRSKVCVPDFTPKKRPRSVSFKKIQKAIEMINEGYSIDFVASTLNIPSSVIIRYFKQLEGEECV